MGGFNFEKFCHTESSERRVCVHMCAEPASLHSLQPGDTGGAGNHTLEIGLVTSATLSPTISGDLFYIQVGFKLPKAQFLLSLSLFFPDPKKRKCQINSRFSLYFGILAKDSMYNFFFFLFELIFSNSNSSFTCLFFTPFFLHEMKMRLLFSSIKLA